MGLFHGHLPVLPQSRLLRECKEANRSGDQIVVNVTPTGRIIKLKKGIRLLMAPYCPFMWYMIEEGGGKKNLIKSTYDVSKHYQTIAFLCTQPFWE